MCFLVGRFIFNHVLFDWEVWLSEGAVDGALDVTQRVEDANAR